MKTIEEYREEYLLKIPIYEKLGSNLCESIELILQEAKIDNLKVYYRIKDVNSFIEKIERKIILIHLMKLRIFVVFE